MSDPKPAEIDPEVRIRELAAEDGRYAPEAFFFVSDAIRKTVGWVRDKEIEPRDVGDSRGGEDEFHVSGQELLVGLRRYARERWGMMARRVLAVWGVRRSEDVGEIVFLMVEDPWLGWRKRECDRREDFAGGFDFETGFDEWSE